MRIGVEKREKLRERLEGVSGDVLVYEALRFYRPKKIAIAFSGGMDSLAMTLLVLDTVEMLNWEGDVFIVFNNTTNEIPESLYYTRRMLRWFEDHFDVRSYEIMPKRHYAEFLLENFDKSAKMFLEGKWCKNAFRCCYYLKEKPSNDFYRKMGITMKFTGIRGLESWQRYLFARETLGIFDKGKIVHVMPLWNWTKKDVIDFIENHPSNPPINPIYEMGFSGTGCMMCPIKFFYERSSLKALKKYYPKAYELGMALKLFFLEHHSRVKRIHDFDHPILRLAKKYVEG